MSAYERRLENDHIAPVRAVGDRRGADAQPGDDGPDGFLPIRRGRLRHRPDHRLLPAASRGRLGAITVEAALIDAGDHTVTSPASTVRSSSRAATRRECHQGPRRRGRDPVHAPGSAGHVGSVRGPVPGAAELASPCPQRADGPRDRTDRAAVRRGGSPRARRPATSTSRSTAPTVICPRTFSRRSRTSATTSTAATSSGG